MVPPPRFSKLGRNPRPAKLFCMVKAHREARMTTLTDHPGFSRDPELEKARGGDRPAASNMSGDDHADDPAPDRHIHFAPDPEAEVGATAPTPQSA